jgi:glycosyltransferase involved in cell wall biosynthesis
MRLLVVTNNPQGASFRQRVQVYLQILREYGVAAEVIQLPSGIGARARLFKQAGRYDGVFLHKKKLGVLDALCLRRHARRVIYNYDDAIMYDEKSPAKPGWRRGLAFARTVRLADMVLVGSPYLADFARPHNSNVQVLPIGLQTQEYRLGESGDRDGKVRLVWIGSTSTLRYLRQIEDVLEEIGRRHKQAVLRIICDEFFELANLPVEKRRWSAQTRAADLATSDIGLAPLPDDPFTRGKCSFKVLEYSASGLPVVASPIGTNAQYVREGVTGFLAGQAGQWVERIDRLIQDPSLRKTMGRAGVERAGEFDVQVIGRGLANLIRNCLQGRSGPLSVSG